MELFLLRLLRPITVCARMRYMLCIPRNQIVDSLTLCQRPEVTEKRAKKNLISLKNNKYLHIIDFFILHGFAPRRTQQHLLASFPLICFGYLSRASCFYDVKRWLLSQWSSGGFLQLLSRCLVRPDDKRFLQVDNWNVPPPLWMSLTWISSIPPNCCRCLSDYTNMPPKKMYIILCICCATQQSRGRTLK